MPGAALVIALAFARASVATTHAMVIAAPPSQEVLMVRLTPEGTLETACVDNEQAAKAFLKSDKKK